MRRPLLSYSNIHLTTKPIEGQQLGDFLAMIIEFEQGSHGLSALSDWGISFEENSIDRHIISHRIPYILSILIYIFW